MEERGNRRQAERGACAGDHNNQSADSALSAVFRHSDWGTVFGQIEPAFWLYLCNVCQRGIFPAACSQHPESDYCAGMHELFQGKQSAEGNIADNVPLHFCHDCVQRAEDDYVYSILLSYIPSHSGVMGACSAGGAVCGSDDKYI